MVSSWKSSQEHAKRKGQSSQETGTGKLATYTKEHHWSSSRSSNRNLTKNPPFCSWSSFPPESSEMDLRSSFSWTQETSTLSSFFPLAAPPCWWVLRQPRSSQPGRSPIIHKSKPWRSWGDKAPANCSPSQVWRQNVPVPWGSEWVWRPLWATREKRVAPRSQTPEVSSRMQLCCVHQDWKPKLKCSRITPWPFSKHG